MPVTVLNRVSPTGMLAKRGWARGKLAPVFFCAQPTTVGPVFALRGQTIRLATLFAGRQHTALILAAACLATVFRVFC